MNRNPNDNDPDYRKPFPGPNAQIQQQYKLSLEEMRVLKECNRESFYKRCLPISAFLATSTYFGVKNGFLKANARYGATPKVIVSVVIGYFLGKFSYQSVCAEKLMQLPNSHLGEVLRQRRRGNRQDSLDGGFGSGISLAPFGNISSTDVYSDLNPNNSLNIDTTRPETPGLDDYYRPSLDNPVFEEEEDMPPIQKHTTTYEELRRKNRDEYAQKRLGNYPGYPQQNTPEAPPKTPNDTYSIEREFENKPKEKLESQTPKNKYGDSWG